MTGFKLFLESQEDIEALTQAVAQDPGDAQRYLVLADALEEAQQDHEAQYVRQAVQGWTVNAIYDYMDGPTYMGQISASVTIPIPRLFAVLAQCNFYEVIGTGILSTDEQQSIQRIMQLIPPHDAPPQDSLRFATVYTTHPDSDLNHRFQPPLDQAFLAAAHRNSPQLQNYG